MLSVILGRNRLGSVVWVVCLLANCRDVLRQVKCSELRALCSQEGCRWTQTVMGADFWPMLSADTYAVVMVSGDVRCLCQSSVV